LGASWRVNLRWSDRAIGRDRGHGRSAVELVRSCRPRAVAIPYWSDRHPDHVDASRTLTDALFDSGLRRFDAAGDAWRPEWVCYYFINDSTTPSFVVDVSAHYETKRRALACHRSQFTATSSSAVSTRLTSPNFNQLIESRDAQFGALAGIPYAEGLVVREPMVRDTVFKTVPTSQLPVFPSER
ncbi:MAG TPA: hypothetical protein VM032_14860, partial [Vicinamibacterales bacterium]|nr:hypothetical protein [Vicinamibacterales bacterium]